MSDKYVCVECDGRVHPRRWELGYKVCLDCGELSARSARASWTISLAGHKQGYTLITRKEQLKEINKYANT